MSFFLHKLVVIIVIFTVNCNASIVNNNVGPRLDDYRLPANLRPTHYDLYMRMVLNDNPNFTTFTAPSNVTIIFNCVNSTDTIVLNSQYISVDEDNVRLSEVGAIEEMEILSHTFEPDLHFYKIKTNPSLEAGKSYQLFIPFLAQILTNNTLGLYRGYYTDTITGETKNMATTFFQPFGARRMLPLFDEPDMKAVFKVTIGRFESYHTLANMDLNNTTPDPQYGGWHWDAFNPTVRMSPYILCVIVSDFAVEVADPSIFLGKPVSVWSTPAAIQADGGVYAAKMAAILLNWYQNYTGIDYALPKMDSIAIPQFAAGAMENWGLNTYRDGYLIYKPGDPDSARIGVAETLSHELSHQWFGNYATCEWWDMMWLNEGLATFFTYKALVTLVAPEFDTEMRFINRHHQSALKFDSNPNKSHPVVIPTDGFDFFDGTSMEKGGSLTRMMEYTFTAPVLHFGLISYLEQHAFSSAVQDGLFKSLETTIYELGLTNTLPDKTEEPGQKVSLQEIMHTWTLQTGYPLIRVTREGNSLTISQENIISSQPDHRWWIPIKIVTQDNPDFSSNIATVWIPPTSESITYNLSDDAAKGWCIINPHAVGFYRVWYDDNLRTLINNELLANPNAFTHITRSQLLDDWINLRDLGFMTLEESIEITKYLEKEKNPGVLKSALNNILPLMRKFGDAPHFAAIKAILLRRLESMLTTIGVDERVTGGSGDINMLRNDLLNALCELRSPVCTEMSTKLFENLQKMHPQKRIPVNIQDAMYCGIVHSGGKDAWQLMYNLSIKETDTRQTKILIRSLGCTTDEALISRALEIVENKSLWNEVKKENRYLLVKELVKSSAGRLLYSQSKLVNSDHSDDIKLTTKIRKFLTEFSS